MFKRAVQCLVAVVSLACSSQDPTIKTGGDSGSSGVTGGVTGGGNSGTSGGTTNGNGGVTSSNGGSQISFGGSSNAGTSGGGSAGSCASRSAEAMVLPVYLAFAFDVSGSMGKGDQPWHDRMLKWDPVVAATKAFFEDPASAGLNASVTFFPDEASSRCTDAAYTMPDVAMTGLPSTAPGMAIDAIGAMAWRGGTPTLNVIHGVITSVQAAMQATPGRYVIVLVTDGYPEGCNDNAIASVAAAVQAVAGTIPTYVIGVKNPPIAGAPDTVTNLDQVAMAGGSDHAYIIDTGNPTQTTAAFKAAIDTIRGAAISCNVQIPPAPMGSMFDKQNVVVSFTSNGTPTRLTYDATCMAPNTWHYDDPQNPRQVVLCPNTCSAIQSDKSGSLSIEFACTPQIIVPL